MILLDSHVLIWTLLDRKKLSKAAHQAISRAHSSGGLAISAITLWELAWLAQNGRIRTSGTVDAFVRDCVSRVSILPITPEIAAYAAQLPVTYPKDPQDRMIGATAVIEGIPLVTADSNIQASQAVRTIW